MSHKKYTLNSNNWNQIHHLLCNESNCEHIPNRCVECCDEKLHSPTRATYLLTEEEAENLNCHPEVDWIELSVQDYPELYPKPQLVAQRWPSNVRIYRTLFTNLPPNPATATEENRTNWAVKRVGVQTNSLLWNDTTRIPGRVDQNVITGNLNYTLTGRNVDIIIQDSGVLQYHPEFIDATGKSRVRDVVLDGPYYIDPNYFDINSLTYTKADGRVGIATTAARDWWQDSTKRSPVFATIGTVSVPTNYNAPKTLGVSSTTNASELTDSHGTCCASLSAGKNFGLAFEANIWNMSGIGQPPELNISIDQNYDFMKIFHQYKRINPVTGKRNPTIVNGSWGYFARFLPSTTVNFRFRGSIGTFVGSANPASFPGNPILQQVTSYKNGLDTSYEWSSSSRTLSTEQAGNELMDSGVIFVAAGGNDNLRLGSSLVDPDRINYFTDIFGATDARLNEVGVRVFPDGVAPIGHVQYTHPQGIGYNSVTGFNPVIVVGAMDDAVTFTSKERKAPYSNNGPGIDVWAPADSTLAAAITSAESPGFPIYQRYDDGNFNDQFFNGTSAAAPVTTGLIALYLEQNPMATQSQVKDWLDMMGSVILGDEYEDQVPDVTNLAYWTGTSNMRGAEKRILYNPYETTETPVPPVVPPAPPPPPPPPSPLPGIVDDVRVKLSIAGDQLTLYGISIE